MPSATDVSESGDGVPEGTHGQGAEEHVQVSQNLSLPSNDELEHFRKTDLQAYLKARAVGQTGSRDQLLNLAKLYAARPVVEVTPDQNPLPVDPNIVWKNAASEIAQIPPSFTLETIQEYLSVLPSCLSFQDEEDDETVDSGTQKPGVKGRWMYQSFKLQMAEFGMSTRKDLFLIPGPHPCGAV